MTEIPPKVAKLFPYNEVRTYQDEFVKTIFEAVEDGRSVLIQGSNGLGKTVAVLSACLPKAWEDQLKILYVARTHRQNDRVIEELRAISDRKPISGISVRGRHEMCLNDFVTRHASDPRGVMEVCELLKARDRCVYYRSIGEREDEYFDIQQQVARHPYKASEVQKICRRRGFCPYELVKASLAEAKVVSLSYLYVFDSVIRKASLKNLGTSLHKTILVVDEAHNLPETAVEVASTSLSLFAMRQAEVEAKRFDYKDIANFSALVRNEVEKIIETVKKEERVSAEFLSELAQEKCGIDEPQRFFEHLHEVGNLIRKSLLAEGRYPRSFIHGVGEFLLRWMETKEDPSFVNVITRYTSKRGTPAAKLEIVALDPSKITSPVFSSTFSNVLMSGTLEPLEAYEKIVKLPEGTVRKAVPSPFPKEHILSLVCCGVTTAMEKRTPAMYSRIVQRLKEITEETPANIGVFAASFEVLESLLNADLKRAVKKPLFHEWRGMSSRENEKLVAEFKAYAKNGGAVLIGVQGGRSSEGVDYPGDQMNSVAIVGVPYAEPTAKVKAQINYFEECFPRFGKEYGYIIPAMKKASQAAGRPIRTLEDKGAIIFLDYRFATSYCQRFLPSWIHNNLKILPDKDGAIRRELDRFFKAF